LRCPKQCNYGREGGKMRLKDGNFANTVIEIENLPNLFTKIAQEPLFGVVSSSLFGVFPQG